VSSWGSSRAEKRSTPFRSSFFRPMSLASHYLKVRSGK
jgi:hypothetical protein